MTKSERFAGFSGVISRQSEPDLGLFLLGECRVMDRIHGFFAAFFTCLLGGSKSDWGKHIKTESTCILEKSSNPGILQSRS